jgi:hypothetical protein
MDIDIKNDIDSNVPLRTLVGRESCRFGGGNDHWTPIPGSDTACNFTLSGGGTPSCVTASQGGSWQNTSIAAQAGTFTAQFDAMPSAAGINSVKVSPRVPKPRTADLPCSPVSTRQAISMPATERPMRPPLPSVRGRRDLPLSNAGRHTNTHLLSVCNRARRCGVDGGHERKAPRRSRRLCNPELASSSLTMHSIVI